MNNQKQLGLALLNYEAAHEQLPPASNNRHSWYGITLPFLEQENLADKYNNSIS